MKKYWIILSLLIPIICIGWGITTTIGGSAGAGGEELPYTFDIETLVEDDEFTPPLYEGGEYNFNIDWGDGNNDDITTWDDGDLTHTYADEGASPYSLTITGKLIGWKFDNGGDKNLMKDITQWGVLQLGNTGSAFSGCANMVITATDAPGLTGITNLSNTFQLCRALTTIPGMGDCDVSAVESFYAMFHSADLFTQDITAWNTSSCNDMAYMFYGADVFNQAIGVWDVSNVTTMTWMFYQNEGFNGDISGWTTSSLASLSRMFSGAIAFNQDIRSWDLSNATSLEALFNGATSFDQNLDTLNISTITNMANMLNGVTMSTVNYSNTLIGWEAQDEQGDVVFNGGNSLYNPAGSVARSKLMANSPWTITDGGRDEVYVNYNGLENEVDDALWTAVGVDLDALQNGFQLEGAEYALLDATETASIAVTERAETWITFMTRTNDDNELTEDYVELYNDAVLLATLMYETGNQWKVEAEGGSTSGTETVIVAASTKYIKLRFKEGTGVNAEIEFWASTNGTDWTNNLSITDGTSQAQVNKVLFLNNHDNEIVRIDNFIEHSADITDAR